MWIPNHSVMIFLGRKILQVASHSSYPSIGGTIGTTNGSAYSNITMGNQAPMIRTKKLDFFFKQKI